MDREQALAGMHCELLYPKSGKPPTLRHIRARPVGSLEFGLQWWEQVTLPIASRGCPLLNLSGSAPWSAARRSVCVLHDAAVFDHPDAYQPLFRWWYRTLFRRLAGTAAGLATVSSFSRERLSAVLHLPSEDLPVLSNGCDHFGRVTADYSVLAGYGLRPEGFLLVVGTAKTTKNLDMLFRAWEFSRPSSDLQLVWVGGANFSVFSDAHSVDRARSCGIVSTGFITDGRLKALYETAAGLIVPSLYEGFGLPAAEAMFCGCPVAAGASAALPEVCGQAALYFDPNSLDSIGAAIVRLVEDADLRAKLRKAGLERAALLTWDHAVQGLLPHLRRAGVATERHLEANLA